MRGREREKGHCFWRQAWAKDLDRWFRCEGLWAGVGWARVLRTWAVPLP